MSDEVKRQAFDPFFTTKAGTGTGLGLSQVHGFIKQSGGHIKIYSEPGEGTTVHVYLPRSYSAASIEKEVPQPAKTTGSETILIVEDDPQVRSFVSETLSELNYRVLSASDAETALEVLDERSDIDLVLTDVVLPGMNGKALSAEIQKRCPDIHIIFMTGYSRNAIVHHGRLDAGVQLLQKPLTQSMVAAKIRRVLDSPAAQSKRV